MYCMMCGGKLCDGASFCHQCGANVPVIANPVSGAAGGTLSAAMPCTKETGRKGKESCSEQETLREEINSLQLVKSKLSRRVKELEEEVQHLKNELDKKAEAAKEQEDESLFSDELKNEGDGQDAIIRYDQDQHLDMSYRELRKKYDELKATENDLKGEIKKHLEEHEKLSNELANIKDELNMKNLRIQELHKETENVKREKNEKLTRFKQHVWKQMSEREPNITDANGHKKLVEMYSELYNNEWTNAFKVLTETIQMDEKKAIELLLRILRESSKHASDVSQSDMKAIEKIISGSSEEPTPECKRLLREARKHVDIQKVQNHLQTLAEKLTRCDEGKYTRVEKVKAYSKKCFQLCWLMSIQDPPVVLYIEHHRGTILDTRVYKYYKNSGDNIDYVVWPALVLYHDGSLIFQGVAQTCSTYEVESSCGRQERNDEKWLNETGNEKERMLSGSDRMNKRTHGHHTRNNDTVLSKSGLSTKETRSYSEEGGKHSVSETNTTKPNNTQVIDLTKSNQQHVFRNSHEKERFKKFSEQAPIMREQDLRRIYGTDYDDYYTLYINQKFGGNKFT